MKLITGGFLYNTETLIFNIIHMVSFYDAWLSILNHIFFLLQCKFIKKNHRHTINLCNFNLWKHSGNRLNVIIQHYKFNTFITIFLIINEIYLFLFRTHINIKILYIKMEYYHFL